ncbi:Aste57867_13340 [Aphanomyces stellatus]|uniref:Aste57867_13340 protein n=1 Tax=Aphanomyces stellatus TaxID=120398 RepID=A0A485KY65_9STRA|nr:hypothetical protein As57867_013290 [Aphanomyces stellatus]VFT90179.1 Aste57867_13340 [Aphanomyces stellatus]
MMEEPSDVGAPSVWKAPDWSEHPVLENFYGAGPTQDTDTDSPYDVVFSPMTKHMTAYHKQPEYPIETDDEDDDDSDDAGPSTKADAAMLPQLTQVDIAASHIVHTMRNLTQECHGGSSGNPQGGMSPPSVRLELLQRKLQSSLDQVEIQMQKVVQLYDTYESTRPSSTDATAPPPQPFMLFGFALFCAPSSDASLPSTSDGLPRLCSVVARAAYHRGMNQLLRHRRHIRGVMDIVRGNQVTDMALAAKELAALAMGAAQLLLFDTRHHLLSRQAEWLHHLAVARDQALHVNDHPSMMGYHPLRHQQRMKRLLEAASWYRWLQQHAGGHDKNDHRDSLTDVLSGEEFFSEYYDLMATKEWWSVVQAQFENLVFASMDARFCHLLDKLCLDGATLYSEAMSSESEEHGGDDVKRLPMEYGNVHYEWLRDPQPEHVLQFVETVTRRVRQQFAIQDDVHKSLHALIQRTLYPRMTMLCFNGTVLHECARKDKLWRDKQRQLRGGGLALEQLGISTRTADKLRVRWTNPHVDMFTDARKAFGAMTSWVPCDLLDEMMHGVVVLHHEAAQVFGTTRIAVDTFFPLLSFVLLYADLPFVHAQLHLLEQFALANPAGDHQPTRNGEESYYVYCMHAAVEHICSFARP